MFLTDTTPEDESSVEEMGSQTSQIKQMQAVIGAPQTGRFDEATFDALKTFQASNGLKVTGYPNDETVSALQRMNSALGQLSWWDWAIIYAFEYRYPAIGIGLAVVGGIAYWLLRGNRR